MINLARAARGLHPVSSGPTASTTLWCGEVQVQLLRKG